jgi:hypothetical protein
MMIHSGSRIPDVKYYINRWLRVCLCVCVCVCVCVYDVTQPSALGPLAALCRDRLAQLELLLADGPLERDPVPPPRLHHLGPRARRNVHTAEERRNNQTAATTNSSSNTSVLQMRWHGMSADDTPGAQEKRKKIARKPENRKNLAIAETRTKNPKKTKKKNQKKAPQLHATASLCFRSLLRRPWRDPRAPFPCGGALPPSPHASTPGATARAPAGRVPPSTLPIRRRHYYFCRRRDHRHYYCGLLGACCSLPACLPDRRSPCYHRQAPAAFRGRTSSSPTAGDKKSRKVGGEVRGPCPVFFSFFFLSPYFKPSVTKPVSRAFRARLCPGCVCARFPWPHGHARASPRRRRLARGAAATARAGAPGGLLCARFPFCNFTSELFLTCWLCVSKALSLVTKIYLGLGSGATV